MSEKGAEFIEKSEKGDEDWDENYVENSIVNESATMQFEEDK